MSEKDIVVEYDTEETELRFTEKDLENQLRAEEITSNAVSSPDSRGQKLDEAKIVHQDIKENSVLSDEVVFTIILPNGEETEKSFKLERDKKELKRFLKTAGIPNGRLSDNPDASVPVCHTEDGWKVWARNDLFAKICKWLVKNRLAERESNSTLDEIRPTMYFQILFTLVGIIVTYIFPQTSIIFIPAIIFITMFRLIPPFCPT